MRQKTSNQSDKYHLNLHKGARPSTFEIARRLRRRQTEAEQKLWSLLRNRKLKGKKFRRQHAVSDFIVDFYCHECGLAVELDGHFHIDAETKKYDSTRTALLNDLGITVLRFWNKEVIKDSNGVLKRISNYLY